MDTIERVLYSRRDFGKMVLAAAPLSIALSRIDSRIQGVQIGAITYSFRSLPNPDDIIKAFVAIGLGEMELMSGDAERLAGAPRVPRLGRGGPGGGQASEGDIPVTIDARTAGRQMTPEQQRDAAVKALHDWRVAATAATFKPVRDRINGAGIELRLLCYNINTSTPDDEIEYAFNLAKWLGVKAISTSTQVSMAKRIGAAADRHKLTIGFHGHDQSDRPDEISTEATFLKVFEASKYIGANLDIGHYTAANGDPMAFIRKHHARITNLHLKDRKRDHGANLPWGQGDTPIREVLRLLKTGRYDIPANIEFEYPGDPLVEIPKCLQFCREALA